MSDTLTGEEIVKAVMAWRPFLVSRLDSAAAEEVHSELLALVWEQRSGFDPEKGTLHSWTGGFARNLVARRRSASVPIVSAELEPVVSGPEDEWDSRCDRLLLRIVASHISDQAYAVLALRAYEPGSIAEHAASIGLTVPRFRSLLDEIRVIGLTARAAVLAARLGESLTEEQLLGCVPSLHGLDAVAQLLDTPNPVACVRKQRFVSAERARKQVALARQLVALAREAFDLAVRELGEG